MLQADEQGRVSGSFSIPDRVPVGAKRVTFRGSGGSEAVSTYTAQGWRTITTAAMASVTQLVPFTPPPVSPSPMFVFRRMDPVAQTHTFLSDRQISGYDIMVSAVGDRSKPIILQARNTDNGYPGPEILDEAIIDMTDMVPGRFWRRGAFSLPYLGRNETGYALVALCDDAEHSIHVAKVGGFDQERGWVGRHPYNSGSFFDGSDNKAWKVKPEYAMTYRAVARKYIRPVERLEIGAVEVSNLTDLIPMVLADRPQGTEVEVEITLPNGQKHILTPAAAVALSERISGELHIALVLRGSATLSPIVFPEAQLIAGTLGENGNYVSRAFEAGLNTRIRAMAKARLPGDASAVASVQIGEDATGPIWKKLTEPPIATPLGDGWVQFEWETSLDTPYTRVALDWIGNPASRPEISEPRAAVMLRT